MKKAFGAVFAICIFMILGISALASSFCIDYGDAVSSGNLYRYLSSILIDANEMTPENLEDIASYTEYAVKTASTIWIPGDGNSVTVSGEEINSAAIMGEKAYQQYEELFENRNIVLNRAVKKEVMLIVNGFDTSKEMNIIFSGKELENSKTVDRINVLFDRKNEYISFSSEDIATIIESYGEVKLSIEIHESAYTITFLDASGNIIEKLPVSLKAGLSTDNQDATVYAVYDGNEENWGGQYNRAEGLIEFMTAYSGEYNVVSAEVNITDIDDLTDEEKQAVMFMVLRGYFSVNDGKFEPNGSLTRYQYTEAVVRMFFALDNDAETKFSDVDEKYRKYIASSEASNIVKGYPDGTFRGNNAVEGEQVIALAARTISEKCGYIYPDKPEEYLKFENADTISDWAKKDVALAIREGIYDPSLALDMEAPIKRVDAAVTLYRLFMILNNTPEISVSNANGSTGVHKTFWTTTNTGICIGATAAVDAAALTALLITRKRKRKI